MQIRSRLAKFAEPSPAGRVNPGMLPSPALSPTRPRVAHRGRTRPGRWWLALLFAGAAVLPALADTTPQAVTDFGVDVQLAPFVVNGKPLSISIHARTQGDRRYGEKFADEVVEVAYETLGDTTGRGLVIVGAKGEPHPILVFRRFLALSRSGQLDPNLTPAAAELEALLKKLQDKMKIDEDPKAPSGITFDTFLPALPLPLEGAAGRLYQLAWAEGFDDARIEHRLRSLTPADLTRDEFTRYDWVFYLPPQSVTSAVFKDLVKKAMAAQKMGPIKRAAVRSALFVFRPAVNQAFEAMRKGMLFMAILRAESPYNEGDIDALTRVYVRVLMPDLKPGVGHDRKKALAAIAKQKEANLAYAKDPFVSPPRLAAFDPAAYAPFEGEYIERGGKVTCAFQRQADAYAWLNPGRPPLVFHPAGDRLLVSADGKFTIQFQLDANGAPTGVEFRRERQRWTLPRKV